MARLLYFDCFSGISGDMVLGALLDAGLPLDGLVQALGSLAVSGYDVRATRVLRAGVSATKFDVVEHATGHAPRSDAPVHEHTHSHDAPGGHTHGHGHSHDHTHDHPRADAHAPTEGHAHAPGHAHDHGGHAHRSLPEIFQLIDRSALSAAGRIRAREMFQRLAEAEAAIHQMPVERVHLHEVGALDSIIDIVGAVHALEWAGVDRVVCSPLNVGGGMVTSAHGLFPVPAPATVRILGDAPVYGGTVQRELVTPTGALVATTYASSFGPVPAMRIERVGYGAGQHDPAGTPNVLRVLIGRESAESPGDRVVVIESEIDDMNPQLFGSAMERLYAAGALDVFYTPAQMKKNRPGTLVTVVAAPALRSALTDVLFRETTTIGVRYTEMARECLERETVTVETSHGPVRVKVARREGRVLNATPEFEDCARLSAASGASVKEVVAAAASAYARQAGGRS